MSALDQVKSRSLRLLDYLAALAADLRGAPRRRLAEYDPAPIMPRDVPAHHAVRLGPTQTRESWLEVGKVAQPEPPPVPAVLYPYLGGVQIRPDARPALPVDVDDRARDRGEDPVAVKLAYDRWVRDRWQPWAPGARAAFAARRLYERLFELRLLHSHNSAGLQLVWGHALLSWRVPSDPDPTLVEHPLLITPVRLEVDPEDGVVRVLPDGVTSLEPDPVQALSAPGLRELPAMRERVRLSPPDVWDAEETGDLLRQLAAPLGLDARVVDGPDLPPPDEHARVVDTWALFLRPRPATAARFYQELRQAIAERDFLPEAVAAVVAPEGLVADAVAEADERGELAAAPGADDWAVTGRRLLMPLPTNEDQERVAVQLASSRGVTVQGPPGTGKSHTIANLICHLVAHGRRVLVTAQDEQALVVLREKIPAELRHLSVAVLGSSQADIEELRASVVEIQAAVADVDLAREAEQVARLGAELDAVRSRTRALELELVELLRSEEREFDLPHGRARAAEVSAWLAEHSAELGLIPDRLEPGTPPPLGADEFAELLRAARDIDPADAAAALRALPDPAGLPSRQQLAALFDRLDELHSDTARVEQAGVDLAGADALGPDGLAELRAATARGAEALRAVESPWLRTLREQYASSPRMAEFWTAQSAELTAAVHELHELRIQVFGHSVELPDGHPRDQQRLLGELRERFALGRGLPRFGARELRAFHEQLRVDGYPPSSVEEVDIAEAALRGRTRMAAALGRYADVARQLGAPPPPGAGGPAGGDGFAALPWLDEAAEQLAAALAWESTGWPGLALRLRRVFPALPARPTADELAWHADLLAQVRTALQRRSALAELDGLRGRLHAGRRAADASPLWDDLAGAVARRDLAAWQAALDEADRLRALRPLVERRDALAGRLAEAAPRWAEQILASRADPASCGDPDRLGRMWRWRQAETWLADLHSAGDVPTLQRRLDAAGEESRRLVLEVARRSARLALARNLGSEQRQALTGWVQALSRVGKGTGKFAARWRAEARAHMTAAMGAVPVWIMPVHRVMESFDPRVNDPFDVVIVDESSQCDVLSLGVLSLGRKAVVVGDDQQTSPSAVGVPRDKVFALIEDHLPDVAHRSLLDVEASLYDTAARVFPRTVVLKEHFRCLPEIIGFSNRFYDHQILPLREAPESPVGPALRPVRVIGGGRAPGQFGDANEVEAQMLVDQIVACCNDPAYDGMTFGVVTLLGGGQPRLIEHRLVDKLGEEEYVRRRLRVGDPYQFQGDERDVIFISVVADDNRSAATRRRDMQRINVAASRARDQLWVFHTVAPETLRDDDVRRQLIEYMYATRAPAEEAARLADRCESDFERAVLREILARGYRVRPQYPVGKFRIDLVVEGASGGGRGGAGGRGPRLAVECDGDRYHGPDQWEADLRRQRILERLGWTFWRIRGSEFYRHPQRTLDGLWRRLDQLGIRPVTDAGASGGAVPPQAEPPRAESLRTGAAQTGSPQADPSPTVVLRAESSPTAVLQSGSLPTGSAQAGLTQAGPTRAEAPQAGQVLPEPSAPAVPAEVPAGYRHAGWVRPEEAEAVLGALARGGHVAVAATGGWARRLDLDADLHADPDTALDAAGRRQTGADGADGTARRQAAYHHALAARLTGAGEPVALLARPRRWDGGGGRLVACLTSAEARAVLAAAEEGRDIPVGAGGGLVQYVGAGSALARAYGSATRLLRPHPAPDRG